MRTVKYDDEGKLICQICGKSFDCLGSHVTRTHGYSSVDEYKKEFGIYKCIGLISDNVKSKLRTSAYRRGLNEKIVKFGERTMVKKGMIGANHIRYGKKKPR